MPIRTLSPATENRIRDSVKEFLSLANLEDASLVLDGPGIGCTSHTLVLGLIGIERLLKMRAVHSFSSSSYGTLFFLAKHFGELTLDSSAVVGWNRRNQNRHRVAHPFQILQALPNFIRQRSLFSHDRTFEALECSVSPGFVNRKVGTLPSNFHFWVYNQTDKVLESIHSTDSRFQNWTMGEVIRAVVSIPYIYQAFRKDDKVYRDPMFSPQVRDTMRELRSSGNVLFWNMGYTAKKAGLIAVKGHDSKSSIRRLISDELLFLTGIDNPEFDLAMKRGIFEVKPL